jgi:hypothetical protein
MAQVYYRTQEEIKGPWLFSRERLQRLDAVIDAINEMLKAVKKEGDDSKRFPPERRQVEVIFSSRKKVTGTTFADVERVHPESEGGTVKKFEYIFIKEGITTTIIAENAPDEPEKGKAKEDLTIKIEPEWNPLAGDIFARVREWAAESQLPLRDRVFERQGGWLLLVGLALLIAADPAPTPSGAVDYKAQAREMAAKGITQADIPKATELLLLIAAGSPASSTQNDERYPLWALVGGLGLIVMALYPLASPTLIIGLGNGMRRIFIWSLIRRSLLYGLPALAFVTYIIPKLSMILGATK